jgi:hypothetical protein
MSARRPALLVGLGALLVAAVIAASAFAAGASSGLVRSFGHGGRRTLTPKKPPGVKELVNDEWLGTADGSAYVLANSKCYGCGGPHQYLFKFDRGGRFDASFAGGRGYVELPGNGERTYALAVDHHGRALAVGDDHGPKLIRFTRAGRPDRGFGEDGVVRLSRLGKDIFANSPTVSAMPGGGLLVSVETPSEGHGFSRFALAKLREDGTLDRGFGRAGVARVDAAGEFHLEAGPTALPDGSVLIVSTGLEQPVTLTRVSARGRLDTRYDQVARRSLRPLAKLNSKLWEGLEAYVALARANGGVDLFGFGSPHGFDMRVEADGRADAAFGRRGLKVLPLPVSGVTPLPGGEFLAVGNEFNQPTVAYVVSGDGTRDRRFPPTPLGHGSFGGDPVVIDKGLANIVYGIEIQPEDNFKYGPTVARLALPTTRKVDR